MPHQYVYTSAKRGLEPGKSGFCCVARDRDVPPDLVSELERLSRYQALTNGPAPHILRYHIATLRSGTYHILSQLRETGVDYSKRNNHLAHHLAFAAAELPGLPNPATLLLQWNGWRSSWDEPPRILAEADAFHIQNLDTAPRSPEATPRFPFLCDRTETVRIAVPLEPNAELSFLEHIRQSLLRLPTEDQWRSPFTTCLLPTDAPHDYHWSGIRDLKSLPYEIDFQPHPLAPSSSSPNPQPTSQNLTSPRDTYLAAGQPDPSPLQPSAFSPQPPITPSPHRQKKPAPIVEIPDDYDRRKHRRPKRKFGPRELSRSINLAIGIAAALCIAILVYIFYHLRDSLADDLPLNATAPEATLDSLQTAWNTFATAGYPARELSNAAQIADTLKRRGIPEPAQIVDFLQAFSASEAPARLPVPNSLIRSENNAASLLVSPRAYPALDDTILIPAQLIPLLRSYSAPPLHFETPTAFLRPTSFSPQLLENAIDAARASAESDLADLPSAASSAIDAYLSERFAIENNSQFAPFLALPRAFNLPNTSAYIAFDPDGLLLTNTPTPLTPYLTSLLQTSPSSSLPATTSPYDTALQLHQAILEAHDRDPARWRPILQAWELAFVREDLMQQTIVGYTLEALEAAKIKLVDLRSRFSRDELARVNALATLDSHAKQLRAAAKRIQGQEEWVVIHRQTLNLAEDHP